MPRIDRDGLTLAACVVSPGLMLGIMLLFPIWVPGWMRDFGETRGAVMLVYTVAGLLMTLGMAVVGRLLTRVPAWRLVVAGALITGIGLVAASRIHGFYAFAAVYALAIGPGVASASLLPCQYLAVRLFPRRMGAIAGLIMLSMAGAGVVLPLALTPLLAALGWRPALALAGVAVAGVVALLACTLMRTARVGAPTAAPGAGGGDAGLAPAEPLRTGQILRSGPFWIIVVATMPLLGVPTGVQANLLPILKDHGVGTGAAGLVLAVLSVGTSVGALLFGWLADRIRVRALTLSIALVMAAAVVVLASAAGLPLACAAVLLLGCGSGGTLPLSSILTFRQYGAGYAPVLGLLQIFLLPYTFAPPAIGWIRDRTGSYTPSLLVLAAVMLVCALATRRLRPIAASGRMTPAHVPAE